MVRIWIWFDKTVWYHVVTTIQLPRWTKCALLTSSFCEKKKSNQKGINYVKPIFMPVKITLFLTMYVWRYICAGTEQCGGTGNSNSSLLVILTDLSILVQSLFNTHYSGLLLTFHVFTGLRCDFLLKQSCLSIPVHSRLFQQ